MTFDLNPLKRKHLLFISLFLSTNLIIAQTEFRPGFIITNDNDTIYGEIDFRSDKFMSENCRFRNINEEITLFTPDELSGYRILNSKYFVSHTINGKNEFLEFLINGQINIFYKSDETGPHYYLEKVGEKIVEMPYKEQYVTQNGVEYRIKSTEHIGLLLYYMKDAPQLQASIYKIVTPEHSNLIKLAEEYHNKVCKDQECIKYGKEMNSFKFEIEVQGGTNKFSDIKELNSWTSQAGLIVHISSPMISEKYILRTGIQYSEFKVLDINGEIDYINLINIPIGIEYLYPRGVVRPIFAAGINLYNARNYKFFELSFSTGLNLKISNSVSLALNYNIDLPTTFLLMAGPIRIDRHSFSAGLRFRL